VARTRGGTRVDMAPGCPEHLDLSFLWYIAAFPWTARKRTLARLTRFDGKLIRLRSSAEVRGFLASLDGRG
jgi:hypothetical protein